jgi:hypothetical protein
MFLSITFTIFITGICRYYYNQHYNLKNILEKMSEKDFIQENPTRALEIFINDLNKPIFLRNFAANPSELLLNYQLHPQLTYDMVTYCPELVLIAPQLIELDPLI